jgi:hypothetical protein
MPTLRFRRFEEIPPEDQEQVNFLRARIRGREEIDGIFGAQAHWRRTWLPITNRRWPATSFKACSRSSLERRCTSQPR